MSGRIVNVSFLDSIRVECLDRALTIPASLVLDADAILRHTHRVEDTLTISPVEIEETGEAKWEAAIGNEEGAIGDTPWGAVVALAKAMGERHGQ